MKDLRCYELFARQLASVSFSEDIYLTTDETNYIYKISQLFWVLLSRSKTAAAAIVGPACSGCFSLPAFGLAFVLGFATALGFLHYRIRDAFSEDFIAALLVVHVCLVSEVVHGWRLHSMRRVLEKTNDVTMNTYYIVQTTEETEPTDRDPVACAGLSRSSL